MANISGISSGLDTESIINGLMALKRQQVNNLTLKKEKAQAKESVWSSISSALVTLQISNYKLARTATFGMKSAVSSNENALSVSATTSAAAGTYSFYVNRLAQASQLTSTGFSNQNTTKITSTEKQITIESSAASMKRYTELSALNGGNGVTRGNVFVQDRDGNSSNIDLTKAQDIYDVIDAFNASGLKISASINNTGDGINISYTGSSTASNLIIRDVGNGTTASDLGISTGALGLDNNIRSGDSIYYLFNNVSLSHLNSGLGVEKGSFIINNGGEDYTINISEAKTVGDVLKLINNSGSGVTASLSADKKSISLNGENISVLESGKSSVARGLGLINISGVGGEGSSILGGLGSVLSSNLYGATGNGIRAGSFDITGDATSTINVLASDSITEILAKINNEAGNTGVYARINSTSNGIELYKKDGNSFSITDSDTSRDLGLFTDTNLGSSSSSKINGSSLNFGYITRNSLLSDLNQGDGFKKGSITITNKDNQSFNVNLAGTNITTIGDVIDAINSASEAGDYNVTASINSTGNGILIKNNSDDGNISIGESGNSTTAKSLGILGSSTTGEVDGAFKKVINVTSDYSLSDLRAAINSLGINMSASIINDGSSDPYRLVLNSTKAGRIGSFTVSSDIESLQFNTAVEAKDSLIIMGEPTSEQAVFVKSSSNTITDFISGMTLNLKETSANKITITITNDHSEISTIAEEFVENYNTVMSKIKEQLKYDSSTGITNPLFGDTNLMVVQQDLFAYINRGTPQLTGSIKSAAQVGINLGLDGLINFDKNKFEQALKDNFQDVTDFFTYNYNASSGSTLSASSTTAGNINGIKDGNTGEAALLAGNTGWQGENGSFIEMAFDKKTDLTSLKLFGTSMDPNDIIQSFTLQYLSNGVWKDYRTIANNISKDISINMVEGLVTNKIRFNNITTVGGGDVKIAEIQTFQPVGLAQYFDYKISSITDASRGSISNALDSSSSEISLIDTQIASMEERLVIEEERLRAQFVQLEKMMSELSNTSSWLSQQTSSLNANWSYKK